MKYTLALIFALSLSVSAMADTTSPSTSTDIDYKTSSDGAGKEVKTNGKISTSGCETKEGKIITESEQGYDECVRQVGSKHHHHKKKKKIN
jgi:hypothetical protein